MQIASSACSGFVMTGCTCWELRAEHSVEGGSLHVSPSLTILIAVVERPDWSLYPISEMNLVQKHTAVLAVVLHTLMVLSIGEHAHPFAVSGSGNHSLATHDCGSHEIHPDLNAQHCCALCARKLVTVGPAHTVLASAQSGSVQVVLPSARVLPTHDIYRISAKRGPPAFPA